MGVHLADCLCLPRIIMVIYYESLLLIKSTGS